MATASSKSSSVRIIQEGRKLLEERLDPKIVGQLVLHGLIDEQAFATVDKAGENGGLTEKRECLTEILLAALDSEDKAKSFKKVLKDTQEDLYRDLFPDPETPNIYESSFEIINHVEIDIDMSTKVGTSEDGRSRSGSGLESPLSHSSESGAASGQESSPLETSGSHGPSSMNPAASPVPMMEFYDYETQNVDGVPATEADESLVRFFDLMVGNKRQIKTADSLLVVEGRQFTPNILTDCYEKCEGVGLARELCSYMVDLLKRQQTLEAIADMAEMERMADDELMDKLEDCLPDDYFEYTHKDLFIALLEVTPSYVHNRLMSLAMQVGCSVPFLYRHPLSNGNIGVRLPLHGYDDLLCDAPNPLIVSFGTGSTIAGGKSELLADIFGLSANTESRSRLFSPSRSVCHRVSIDLIFGASLGGGGEQSMSFLLADTHGYSRQSLGLNIALAVLTSSAAAVLLHVTRLDFTNDGKPASELQFLLDCMKSAWEQFSFGPRFLALLWRNYVDADKDLIGRAKTYVELNLVSDEFCLPVIVRIFDVPSMKSLRERRRVRAISGLAKSLDAELAAAHRHRIPTMCGSRELARRIKRYAPPKSFGSTCVVDVQLPSYAEAETQLGNVQRVLHDTLNRIVEDLKRSQTRSSSTSDAKRIGEVLFPTSTLVAETARLEDEMRSVVAMNDVDAAEMEAELVKKDTLLAAVRRKRATIKTSQLVKEFANYVADGNLAAIQEFQRQLTAWKAPRCRPLLERRRNLLEKFERRLAVLQQTGARETTDNEMTCIKSELRKNGLELDLYDVSIDDVWSELTALVDVEVTDETGRRGTLLSKDSDLSKEQLADVYRQWILNGNPMQLLRGHPLYMASEFVSSVLRRIQAESTRRLFVVSVIGLQSSAKSTLLNYLFGCGFATRAGRCTRGLYASYMQTPELDLLILDSEGLMSIEGGGRDFDNQVTLMAMACSHVVIVNHKGELSRQLQELLEIAVFAMKNLEVARLQPDILFVLRDQVDRDAYATKGQLMLMRQGLTARAEKLQVEVNRFVNLNPESLYLLPPAFANELRNGKEFKLPTKLFSNESLQLRQRILKVHSERVLKQEAETLVEEFSSFQQWLVHARSVWTTISHFGASLLHFENMQQIEQRREVSAIYSEIVETLIEAPHGFVDQCQEHLQAFMVQYSPDQIDEKVSRHFRDTLDMNASVAKEEAQKRLDDGLKSGNYLPAWKQEFSSKLRSRIDEALHVFFRAWRRREALAKDEVRQAKIEKSLSERMDHILKEGGGIKTMSADDLQKAFDDMWKDHLEAIRGNLMETMMDGPQLQMKVIASFAAHIQTMRLRHPVCMALGTSSRVIPPMKDLIVSSPESHYVKYVHQSAKERMKNRVHVIGKEVSYDAYKTQKKFEAARFLKKSVGEFFYNLMEGFRESADVNLESQFVNSVMTRTNNTISELERAIELRFNMSLSMQRFANDVYDCIRYAVNDLFSQKQQAEVNEKIRDLNDKKEVIRERAMARLDALNNDVWRARLMARDVYSGLVDWSRNEIIQFTIRVESEMRQRMPDCATATRRAYEDSFLAEDWEAVLSYCDDAFGFLRQIFDKRFGQLQQDVMHREFVQLSEQMNVQLKFLREVVVQWRQLPRENGENGESPPEKETTESFVQHAKALRLRRRADSVRSMSSISELDILSLVPTNLEVIERDRFSRSFLGHLDTMVRGTQLYEVVESMFHRELDNVKHEHWDRVRGCREVCPICNSKCDQESNHLEHGTRHRCHIHLLPAFHGSRHTYSKTPVLQCCTSPALLKMPWRSRRNPDERKRTLREYIAEYYPDWEIQPANAVADEIKLRRAWVNCRLPLLEKHDMEDNTPQTWIRLYQQPNALIAPIQTDSSKF
ncbi:uncharacterized protein [Oscarella lobularis]|uniref:uncharacterized protein isoform X2 n=1 Tax=Oscarella lobularis TaxID=121494 RepID=UPI003313D10B